MEKSRYVEHHTAVLNSITLLKGYSGGHLLGTQRKALQTSSSLAAVVPGAVALIPEEVEEFNLHYGPHFG